MYIYTYTYIYIHIHKHVYAYTPAGPSPPPPPAVPPTVFQIRQGTTQQPPNSGGCIPTTEPLLIPEVVCLFKEKQVTHTYTTKTKTQTHTRHTRRHTHTETHELRTSNGATNAS